MYASTSTLVRCFALSSSVQTLPTRRGRFFFRLLIGLWIPQRNLGCLLKSSKWLDWQLSRKTFFTLKSAHTHI
ncbi:hypothetical protein DEU56DRAFT_813550 [Suillus clintonianus]|uniref:uncharacterized protein n=1 Tax=Suillus clintonianus TaxID=1904413 RepID=UPI001B880D74|nr:uncharacterized protein DEU56DRAFT_813550 [Suillus clintonianus]KAG2131830.1 hypothetical protein DEU56DRAFT_813550 [Suillus clintonianus]